MPEISGKRPLIYLEPTVFVGFGASDGVMVVHASLVRYIFKPDEVDRSL